MNRYPTQWLRTVAAVSLLLLAAGCGEKTPSPVAEAPAVVTPAPTPMVWPEQAPDVFKIRFTLSNGVVLAEFHKDWAPIGVEHFYQLLRVKFFDEARIFRVVPGFVVQFGIHADPAIDQKYAEATINDEPVAQSNTVGTITFAKSGMPNSRSTQLFINLNDNPALDGMGFAPIGLVLEGMDVVRAINPEYGEAPDQEAIHQQGNAYLNQQFPRLDYIQSAELVQ